MKIKWYDKLYVWILIMFGVVGIAWAADEAINARTELAEAPNAADEIPLYDTSATAGRSLGIDNLFNYLGDAHDTEAELTALFSGKETADAAIVKSDEAETLTANWVNTANPWAINEIASIDEDDMATDSAAHVPTQQSVKAYADKYIAGTDVSAATGVPSVSGGTVSVMNEATFKSTYNMEANTDFYAPGGTDVADADVADNITITAGSQIASGSPTFTAVGTGGVTFTDQNASPDDVGELLYDNTVANMEDGMFTWWDDDEIRYIVDLDTLPSDDGYVVSYDAATDRFVMASAGAATAWDDIGNPDAADEIDFGAYVTELNVEDFRIGDGGANYVKFSDTGITFAGTYTLTHGTFTLVDEAIHAQTGTSDADYFELAAYDVDGTAYEGLFRLVAGNTIYGYLGDNQTNAIRWDESGNLTFQGTADIDLPDDSVDTADISTDAVTMDSVDADGAFTSLTGAWATTGLLSGGVVTNSKSGAYTIGTDNAAEKYGGVLYATDAMEYTLPAVLAGMSFTVIDYGGAAIVLDPDAGGTEDYIILDGTLLAQGANVTSTSTTGDMITCIYNATDIWYCASGSPDGDHWTGP